MRRAFRLLWFVFAVVAEAQQGTTFANPINLDYRFMPDLPSRREAADPLIVLFGDEYYLFASKSGGYWRSTDMRVWTLVVPEGFPLEEYAPAVVTIDGRMYYTSHKAQAVYTTDDPKAGKWRKVADIASYADPAFFLDDDGRLYLYFGSGLNGSISVAELDYRSSFKVVSGPAVLMTADYEHHGWERSGDANLGAFMAEGFRVGPYVEGAWMTKHNGTYYLQYAAPGTVWKTYADGVYTSTSPMGGFTYAPYSPFSYKPGGFIGSAGHSGMFRDKAGNYWRVTTMDISTIHKFERRIGIFPAGFDADGTIRTDTYLGDYPQYLPGYVKSPLDRNRVPWMLLSAGKTATASTTLAGHDLRLAFDEDIQTQWSAQTGNAGEWLRVDLGSQVSINAIQINFAEQNTTALGRSTTGAQQYRLAASADGVQWFGITDASKNVGDEPHAYRELDAPLRARFLLLTNVRVAGGGKFAVSDLRVFGTSGVAPPPEARAFSVKRDVKDDRSVMVMWSRVPRAQGYVVRYGLSPEKLYHSYQVGDVGQLMLNSLNSGVTYYFTVDAIGEGGVTKGRAVKR